PMGISSGVSTRSMWFRSMPEPLRVSQESNIGGSSASSTTGMRGMNRNSGCGGLEDFAVAEGLVELLFVGGLHLAHRQPHFAVVHAHLLERGLHRDRVGLDEEVL